MVKRNGGFSLIEVMIYCLIAALLSVLLGQFLSKSILVLGKDIQASAECMNLHTAFALIMRDIEEAHSEIASWAMIGNNELIFKTSANDVAWKLTQKGLYRFAGSYDFSQKQWHTVHSVPILMAVSDFSCSLLKEMNQVKAVEITIETPTSKKIRTTISLINGVIS